MIIDSHIHIYDPFRSGGTPWPSPEDKHLYFTTLPDRLKERSVPAGVDGAIHVECSEWVEDNQWILDVANGDPYLVGVVGNLDVHDAAFRDNLARFAREPLFRGIRARSWVPDEIDKLRALAEHDLSLDGGLNEPMLRVAEAIPELRIIINHCATIQMDGDDPDPGAVAMVKRAAQYPNVCCKLSGMMDLRCTIRPAPTDLSHYARYLDILWDAFGEDRMIFGSDWPVSDRSERSYAEVVQLAKDYVAMKSESAWDKVFSGNAKHVYKWVERS